MWDIRLAFNGYPTSVDRSQTSVEGKRMSHIRFGLSWTLFRRAITSQVEKQKAPRMVNGEPTWMPQIDAPPRQMNGLLRTNCCSTPNGRLRKIKKKEMEEEN
ncbi:hypothetical protein LR48_Vigan05g009800 [Vigna angularis]|uniref:Uncharacterized protein n=1 Tax=Phaseolus angularis TaxID=3914 RepID=A0A0L9UIW9_PHAAN|nr:hypothetical protein LR48_Vigan05g009800 [Vigna angularis]